MAGHLCFRVEGESGGEFFLIDSEEIEKVFMKAHPERRSKTRSLQVWGIDVLRKKYDGPDDVELVKLIESIVPKKGL